MVGCWSRKSKYIVIGTGIIALLTAAISCGLCWPGVRFWYYFEPLGLNVQGYPEFRHRKTGIIFVRLPAGKFWMGAQKTDPKGHNYDPEAQDDEGPVNEVTLNSFLIAKYEVTQAQWKRVIGVNPSKFAGDDNHPVEMVSWEDIQKFEAKTKLVLPTNAEWEYACRAGYSTPFAGNLKDLGWFYENSGGQTHPVGTKQPNGFGINDMHGNVFEWCEDSYDPDTSGDHTATNEHLVFGFGFPSYRGGSWSEDADKCRSSYHTPAQKTYRRASLGVRFAWRP